MITKNVSSIKKASHRLICLLLCLVIVVVVGAACSPVTVEPEHSPSETPMVALEQQPSATLDETEESANGTSVDPGTPSQSHIPDELPEQGEKRPATPQETEKPAANQNDAPPTSNTSTPTVSPTDNSSAATTTPTGNSNDNPTPQNDGPVVLTISGDGVNSITTWTLSQLQALKDGYRELTYSTTNNWPSFGVMTAHGISLPYLLRQAGLKDSASSIKLTSNDGFHTTLTYNQVFGKLNAYTNHSASGSSGAYTVESVIAWVWGDAGKARPENLRPFLGQSGPWEVNTASFVKDLCKIEVFTTPAGTWAVPGASIANGSTVSAGTNLELSHGSMDNIRIYYTLDGSEPDYNSLVYNPSTSYFQPHLNKPLVLTESVTVKAFAAGLGKEKSAVVTIIITVE